MVGPARRCWHPNWSSAFEPKYPHQPVGPRTPPPWLITDARQVLLNAALERCIATGAGAGLVVAAQWARFKSLRCHSQPALQDVGIGQLERVGMLAPLGTVLSPCAYSGRVRVCCPRFSFIHR